MTFDPRLEQASRSGDTVSRLQQKVADLERALEELKKARAVYVGDGAPTIACPDGALYIDRTTNRLYARVNAAWRYVGLT